MPSIGIRRSRISRTFRERLQIHGLDLRHTPSVELFSQFLLERLPRLDYILNNACQTVRRPAGFFQHLLERESRPLNALPDSWQAASRAPRGIAPAPRATPQEPKARWSRRALRRHGEGLLHSAALSQRRYLDEDYQGGEALFPADRYDEDLQQIDLREVNSWRLRMHEVETPELLEVQLVNAIAPYVLNARLKPVMLRTPGRHKHVVNVSAVEGQFYRTTKTDKHPHTNMAKAALNMMTRTSAPDFVKDGIHMNAVDTGWVTDEDPAAHAARKAELGFAPPLDIIDGAARIVDPIFAGRLTRRACLGTVSQGLQACPLVAADHRVVPLIAVGNPELCLIYEGCAAAMTQVDPMTLPREPERDIIRKVPAPAEADLKRESVDSMCRLHRPANVAIPRIIIASALWPAGGNIGVNEAIARCPP